MAKLKKTKPDTPLSGLVTLGEGKGKRYRECKRYRKCKRNAELANKDKSEEGIGSGGLDCMVSRPPDPMPSEITMDNRTTSFGLRIASSPSLALSSWQWPFLAGHCLGRSGRQQVELL